MPLTLSLSLPRVASTERATLPKRRVSNGGALATAGGSIVGVTVNLTAAQSNTLFITYPRIFFNVYLQYRGATIGTFKSNVFGAGLSTVAFGSSSDTWGTTLTPTIVNDASFGIIIQ